MIGTVIIGKEMWVRMLIIHSVDLVVVIIVELLNNRESVIQRQVHYWVPVLPEQLLVEIPTITVRAIIIMVVLVGRVVATAATTIGGR
jgi:hypothetical protein